MGKKQIYIKQDLRAEHSADVWWTPALELLLKHKEKVSNSSAIKCDNFERTHFFGESGKDTRLKHDWEEFMVSS